jgi:hypothetical protein
MNEKLNVLALESERGAADVACHELTAAGHSVWRCHEPGATAFPCNALAQGQQCPLDAAIIDVALDVRARPRAQPGPLEDGVFCAIRHHVPVVVSGAKELNPYDDYATELVTSAADVVKTSERAAHSLLREHTLVAARSLRAVLDRRDIDAALLVAVRRHHGALVVQITGTDTLDDATRSMASVRISAALREVDHDARAIDVVFEEY